ncbi:MAG: host-nuclease inhibitor Gam family protein [Ignavibacteriota bacterium]
MNENNFLDELLLEAEQKEIKQTAAYYDLILIEIGKLQSEIESNFAEAEKEIEIIKEWSLIKNSKLQDKIEFLSRKLEAFIIEEGKKTIELPNGDLKFHKKPDKVEITDLNEFLKSATVDMIKTQPEEIKPDLNKIKAYIKEKGRIPKGITVIEGKEEFSYKLKNRKDN